MAGKKISATISAPNSEPYRAYFEEDGDSVLVWRKNTGMMLVQTDHYNGGVFSRDWVRACFLPDVTVTF